ALPDLARGAARAAVARLSQVAARARYLKAAKRNATEGVPYNPLLVGNALRGVPSSLVEEPAPRARRAGPSPPGPGRRGASRNRQCARLLWSITRRFRSTTLRRSCRPCRRR